MFTTEYVCICQSKSIGSEGLLYQLFSFSLMVSPIFSQRGSELPRWCQVILGCQYSCLCIFSSLTEQTKPRMPQEHCGNHGIWFSRQSHKGNRGFRLVLSLSLFLGKSYMVSHHHVMSRHIIYHIISYHVMSYHTIPYHIMSYLVMSYHSIPYHVMPCHIISYHFISFHFIPYHIISYGCSSNLMKSPMW